MKRGKKGGKEEEKRRMQMRGEEKRGESSLPLFQSWKAVSITYAKLLVNSVMTSSLVTRTLLVFVTYRRVMVVGSIL